MLPEAKTGYWLAANVWPLLSRHFPIERAAVTATSQLMPNRLKSPDLTAYEYRQQDGALFIFSDPPFASNITQPGLPRLDFFLNAINTMHRFKYSLSVFDQNNMCNFAFRVALAVEELQSRPDAEPIKLLNGTCVTATSLYRAVAMYLRFGARDPEWVRLANPLIKLLDDLRKLSNSYVESRNGTETYDEIYFEHQEAEVFRAAALLRADLLLGRNKLAFHAFKGKNECIVLLSPPHPDCVSSLPLRTGLLTLNALTHMRYSIEVLENEFYFRKECERSFEILRCANDSVYRWKIATAMANYEKTNLIAAVYAAYKNLGFLPAAFKSRADFVRIRYHYTLALKYFKVAGLGLAMHSIAHLECIAALSMLLKGRHNQARNRLNKALSYYSITQDVFRINIVSKCLKDLSERHRLATYSVHQLLFFE